jgi:hypothetical protein
MQSLSPKQPNWPSSIGIIYPKYDTFYQYTLEIDKQKQSSKPEIKLEQKEYAELPIEETRKSELLRFNAVNELLEPVNIHNDGLYPKLYRPMKRNVTTEVGYNNCHENIDNFLERPQAPDNTSTLLITRPVDAFIPTIRRQSRPAFPTLNNRPPINPYSTLLNSEINILSKIYPEISTHQKTLIPFQKTVKIKPKVREIVKKSIKAQSIDSYFDSVITINYSSQSKIWIINLIII